MLRLKHVLAVGSACLVAGAMHVPALPAPAFSRLFLPTLEHRFTRASLCANRPITGLIVLGGSDERFREAGRLARMLPQTTVIASDNGGAENILRLLGKDIAPERIKLELKSRTTFENAKFATPLAPHAHGERWLLVTSAVHMPRAIGAFRQAGLDAEPWPVHDLGDNGEAGLRAARHEWLGLIDYWAMGKGNALFPAPAQTLAGSSECSRSEDTFARPAEPGITATVCAARRSTQCASPQTDGPN